MAVLITPGYAEQQRLMHENPAYGAASVKFAKRARKLFEAKRPKSILDYGAGKCALRTAMGDIGATTLTEYDPGVVGIDSPPAGKFDLVFCIDVLEHIEPECLDGVLDHIRELAGNVAFLTIHTGPAGKFLSDGRNAHLIQQPLDWWLAHIGKRFWRVSSDIVNDTTAVLVCDG